LNYFLPDKIHKSYSISESLSKISIGNHATSTTAAVDENRLAITKGDKREEDQPISRS
jgi:hypothetical protein